MKVRRFREDDAAAISVLYVHSVEQIGSRDYTPEQVRVWAALAPSLEQIIELSKDGRITLVAVDSLDRPVAFTDLEPDGHIHYLYSDPDVAGSGAATAMYRELERIARETGVTRLYSEASEAARRFFLKQDFAVTQRRDFELGGVAIHNYAMEKLLKGGNSQSAT